MIFDDSRRKWVSLTPEEWVRQNLLKYLTTELNYPISLVATEMSIRIHGLSRRCDLVVFDRTARPVMLIECKAPEVKLSQAVFDQVAHYNWHMKVPYLLISNGLQHYCASIDRQKQSFRLMDHIPDYAELTSQSSLDS